MAPVLLSRALDFGLGVITGVGAYYLHETHPRSGIGVCPRLYAECCLVMRLVAPELRLQQLVKWKWAKYWGQSDAATS
ncbi:hypothetical protein B0H14DRAFT_2660784 [Mycena olivaceomarginata]|nr:hypothetical protein B0H14DRAFT_2660784 [Mycena olivaceomarginata]